MIEIYLREQTDEVRVEVPGGTIIIYGGSYDDMVGSEPPSIVVQTHEDETKLHAGPVLTQMGGTQGMVINFVKGD